MMKETKMKLRIGKRKDLFELFSHIALNTNAICKHFAPISVNVKKREGTMGGRRIFIYSCYAI